ncbi:hypothetical protein IH992_30530, partial [Candidatus Poribacteria bacterium]|nr:hypothetical protein [Candidatus Poribacteria bacterium]
MSLKIVDFCPPKVISNSRYYSIVTFTTLGFGDIIPTQP